MNMYDMYTPLVEDIDFNYSYELLLICQTLKKLLLKK